MFRLTGMPITHYQQRTGGAGDEYRWLHYALWPGARDAQRARLAERFGAMMRAGLLEEVRALYARGDLDERHSAVRAVGYRQLWQYLRGPLQPGTGDEAAIIATAQLAKRQLTWLRRDSASQRLEADASGLAPGLGHAILQAAGA